MEVFEETLDPSETKDFAFDWSPKLSEGETVASQVVAFIDAAGTTNPSNSLASPVSRVWLTGGTHGQRAAFTITATTSGARVLEVALGVDIVDNAIGPVAQTELERLTALKAALQAALLKAAGGTVIEVWNGRYGNKMKYQAMKYSEISAELMRVEQQIEGETNLAAGLKRRRGIGLAWSN